MFTDPQSLTINAIAHSLPRIMMEGLKATYQKADETIKFVIGHTKSNKRVRTLVRTDQQAVVTDPLTSINDYDTAAVYTVIERPEKGFTLEQIQDLVAGHNAWFTPENIEKLTGLQS